MADAKPFRRQVNFYEERVIVFVESSRKLTQAEARRIAVAYRSIRNPVIPRGTSITIKWKGR